MHINLIAVGEHRHIVFSRREDQIIVFTLRAVLSELLIVLFSFVICVDVLGGATLRLWVKLQLWLLLLILIY